MNPKTRIDLEFLRTTFLILFSIVLFSAMAPSVSSVPMFHANLNHTGIFDDFGEGEPNPGNELIWSALTDNDVHLCPAIWNGTVYVSSTSGYLYAFNASNGRQIWKNSDVGTVYYSSPSIWNGTVYVGSYDKKLHAIDASDGHTIWEYSASEAFRSSPAIWNATVYITNYNGYLYAVNASTGHEMWNYHAIQRFHDSSPAVWNGTVYAGDRAGNLYALNASTGHKIWSYDIGSNPISPSIWNGTVYIGSIDNTLYAFNASTGHEMWNYLTEGDIWHSSPAIWNGTVYVGSYDNNLYAFNASTGHRMWSYLTGGDIYSSPAVSNGTVYVCSFDGKLYALDASSGQELWNYPGLGSVQSSPTIWNSTVYVGSDNSRLYAIGTAPAITGSVPASVIPPALVSATISGSNLLPVTSVKMINGAANIVATNLTVAKETVTCDFTVPADAEAGLWDISVFYGEDSDLSKTLADALEVKAQTVNLEANVTTGAIPLPVMFNSTGTGTPVSLNLSFDDGSWHNTTSYTTINTTHTYANDGTYTATLNASFGASVYKESSVIISVGTTVNIAANITSGAPPLLVMFKSTGTGTPVNLNLNFGDGSWHNTTSYTTINTTHTYTNDGIYAATLNVSFGGGVYKESFVTITVNSGGGGGNAGAGGNEGPGSSAGVAGGLKKGETVDIQMNGEATAVTDIFVTVNEDVPQILLTTTKVTNIPSSVPPVSGQVYQYIEIDALKADPDSISMAGIEFSVTRSWLTMNGFEPQDIVMNRFVDGEWSELPTRVVEVAGGTVYYEADTPGFSYFAISYRKDGAEYLPEVIPLGPGPEMLPVTPDQSQPAETSLPVNLTGVKESVYTPYIIIAATLTLFITVILVLRHRKKMKEYPDWWWDEE